LEKLEQLGETEKSEKPERKFERKYSSTRSTRRDRWCIVCGEERHEEKLFFCKQFKSLNLVEKLDAVKRVGACKRCLRCHEEGHECIHLPLQEKRRQEGELFRPPLSPLS